MARKIKNSSHIDRDNGTLSKTISNFRDDFNGGLKDFKLQLNHSNAELQDELRNHRSEILNELERSEAFLEESIDNTSRIARNNGIGLAVCSGIFFMIVLAVPILMYIYKKIKKRKLRSNFTSLYKRSFHFLPVSGDLFQNASTNETPWKSLDSISI